MGIKKLRRDALNAARKKSIESKSPFWEKIVNITYTRTGELPGGRVEMRTERLRNVIYFDRVGEMVLDIECVKEPVEQPRVLPRGVGRWPLPKRFAPVMIGVGIQEKHDFVIHQWASNWERELINAAAPHLALAKRIFIEARQDFDSEVLAGRWVSARKPRWEKRPLWPHVDIRDKVLNVRTMIKQQDIGSEVDRTGDIKGKAVLKLWNERQHREKVWRHNYLDILDTARKIFQIEWPK